MNNLLSPLRFSLLALLCASSLFALWAAPALAQDDGVVVIVRIEGEITTGTAQYLSRAHRSAVEQNAGLFLILLDTPGGLVKATQDMVGTLLASDIPTAAFVHRSGGSAFSAGTYLLLAAETAAAHPNASIGAAQPRVLGGDAEPDPKAVAAMEAFMRSIAEARDRDSALAQEFVTDNLTLTGTEALDAGIVDAAPGSIEELLDTLGLADAARREIGKNIFEQFIAVVSLPIVASLLLTIGSLGVLFSIRSGEFEFLLFFIPLLFLALWAMGTLALSTVGIVLFLCALALLAIEIASPGLGVFGIAGSVLLVASFFFITDEPFFTLAMHGALLYAAFAVLVGFIAFFLWASQKSVQALRQPSATGIEALPGKHGKAITDITPESGAVRIDAYRWDARSDTLIPVGSSIVVDRIEAGIAYVRLSE